MEKISPEQNKIERFLAAPQFQRNFEVLTTYQRLLEENKDDKEKCNLIKERFHDEFVLSYSEEDSEHSAPYRENQILLLLETGKLTKEKLAGFFANSPFAEQTLESFSPKPGSITEIGHKLVNEVVGYSDGKSGGKEDDDLIDLNIIPAPVRGTAELLTKIKEGFQAVAQELKNGSLQHVKEVRMISWLLGSDFADKVSFIFGKNANIVDFKDDSNGLTTREIHKLALFYNKIAAEKYLLTGKLPEIKELKMTSGDFIKRFGGAE